MALVVCLQSLEECLLLGLLGLLRQVAFLDFTDWTIVIVLGLIWWTVGPNCSLGWVHLTIFLLRAPLSLNYYYYFFFWDYKWYYWLLVHYTKIVNLYGYQLFNYCHQILTIKLILYKIMFKLYYIIYHIIKVVTHLVIVPIECALAFYYIFQYFFLMWCGTL